MVKSLLKCSIAGGVFVLVTLFLTESAFAAQTLPFYESFPTTYVEGTRLGSGDSSVVWDLGNSTGTGSATNTAAAALALNGLVVSDDSMGIRLVGTPNSNRDRGVEFNPAQALSAANPMLYVSFLLNVQLSPISTRRVAYLRNSTSSGNNNAAVFLNSANQLQIAKSGDAPEVAITPSLSAGTHLVVMRYKWVSDSSGDDEVALWLDPQSLGVDESSVPGPTISINAGSDAGDLEAFFISQRTADASGDLLIDEIRIATNWAAVTPSSGPPRDPFVSKASMTVDGLVITGTNGPPNGAFLVLSASDPSLLLYQWTVIATNYFDTEGNFACTNPISPADIQMFYRLLVGSEPPPIPTAPSITMQPTNLTVTVGQDAEFRVEADGTQPLYYQWYFNTNTRLSGANSKLLTITNVQDSDAGVYSVVVTNIADEATSTNAILTVNPAPVAPFFTVKPTNQTVAAGQPVTLIAKADGTHPLFYQWFFNTNTLLLNETNSSLTLTSAHATNEGEYSVLVTNGGGFASTNAFLTVLSKPFIITQPEDKTVTVSNDATFTVKAVGTEPFRYQWYFNTNMVLNNETNESLTIANALTNNEGSYSVIITNVYGSTTSVLATLTVTPPITNNARFNLTGFGEATTGSGVIPETDPAYVKVYTPLDFNNAILSANKTAGSVKVIEIMNDLDLGWNEVGFAVQTNGGSSNPFRPHITPKLHPRLIASGVSLIDIKSKSGLTIFSANGATIRHANLNIKDTANIIVRNLKFDELWEWDEASGTPGDYDENDWDFVTLGNGGDTLSNVWIDHCTFTKSYDGIVDIKNGANHITFSWNKYAGDDGTTNLNSFVWQQINSLESNKTSYPMYNFLRTHGFSTTNIVTIVQGTQKTHLIGSTSFDSDNALHSVTLHHQWYLNCWDRLPRLRAGNVHNYNIYVDDTQALAAKRLRDAIVSAMSPADQELLEGTPTKDPEYKFKPFLNGTISTEGGATLVENSVYIDCLTPLRNNQTDPSNPSYTGKIMALDSIYHFDNADMTTVDYRGSSTNAPGDTYFGPVQAPIIPFSWNGFTTLPYSYILDDPGQLESIVTNHITGAGAGVLNWAKTNWLKTSY